MNDPRPKPTHKVTFYGIPCWFDCHSSALWGTNWFFDQLIFPIGALHNVVNWLIGGGLPFPLKVLEEL